MKKKRTAASRAHEAVARAQKTIADAGWFSASTGTRFVACKIIHEREDDSTTKLYESDYTIEGLAALVTRREREEGRKA